MPFAEKIIDQASAVQKVEALKTAGKKVVFTNGCFDILHAGHVTLLEKAKTFGDCLVVGLNTDRSIKEIKGDDRPINSQKNRVLVIAALQSVDYVVLFDEPTPCELIEQLRPDIHVKGGDYNPSDIQTMPEAAVINQYGGKIEIIPLLSDYSTTAVINKLSSK